MATIEPERLALYVNVMEGAICGEYHGDTWPDCDHPNHAEGRAILADLGYLTKRVD